MLMMVSVWFEIIIKNKSSLKVNNVSIQQIQSEDDHGSWQLLILVTKKDIWMTGLNLDHLCGHPTQIKWNDQLTFYYKSIDKVRKSRKMKSKKHAWLLSNIVILSEWTKSVLLFVAASLIHLFVFWVWEKKEMLSCFIKPSYYWFVLLQVTFSSLRLKLDYSFNKYYYK